MISNERLNEIKEKYPVGTKIKLLKDMDDKFPVKAGTIGEVKYIDDMGSLHMRWDTGSSLALILDVDKFKVIERPKKITVVIAEPNKEPYSKEIYDTLEAQQEIVGGLIQYVPSLFSEKINYQFVVNEEGKILGLPFNRFIWNKNDLVAGNLIIVKVDDKSGELVSMTKKEVDYIKDKVKSSCPKCTENDLNKLLNNYDYEVEI